MHCFYVTNLGVFFISFWRSDLLCVVARMMKSDLHPRWSPTIFPHHGSPRLRLFRLWVLRCHAYEYCAASSMSWSICNSLSTNWWWVFASRACSMILSPCSLFIIKVATYFLKKFIIQFSYPIYCRYDVDDFLTRRLGESGDLVRMWFPSN